MNKNTEINEWEEFKMNIKNSLKDFFIGTVPEIENLKPYTGILKPAKKRQITISIKNIVEDCDIFKIGITGNKIGRIDAVEYRKNYDSIRLLYKSTSEKRIKPYEVELIKKFKKLYPYKIQNISETQAGQLSEIDKSFTIYIVYKHAQ